MINQKKYGLKRRKHYLRLTWLADFWLARIMRDCCFWVFLLLLGTKS